ncbi:hypothetical protein IJH24_03635 [Candidatus Saccharibacteria bacterium]|nr:hypothetical protein [Candidatus Saccharibacteria bacterium]
MAKKKKRALRRKKRQIRLSYKDNHHIFFMKRNWSRTPYNKIRLFHYCIIPIPRDTLHKYIHMHMNDIPLPEPIAVEEALKQLRMLDSAGVLHDSDSIEKRLSVLAALFDCAAQPTANALRKQLELVYRFYSEKPP